MDEVGLGQIGSGDNCYTCTVPDSAGRVPALAACYSTVDPGTTAAVAGYALAVDTHAAAASRVHAACSDSHWGSTVTAFAPAWSDCHYLNDSSIIA